MEISPAIIHPISKLTHFQFFQFPCSPCFFSKPNCQFHNFVSLSYQNGQRGPLKWREQLITTWALADDTASPIDLATKPANIDSSLAVKKKATDVYADLKGTSIFLVGMNSTMKSSVGELIADVLRYYYFDSDNVVEEAAGEHPSRKSFRERDDNGFHESETEVLKQLSSMGRLVVNAGNGAVRSATNLALLRHGISIWIDVPLDMVAKGVLDDDDRISFPDSFSETLGQLTKLYEEHRDGYATADVTVSLQTLAEWLQWLTLAGVASKFGYDELEQVTAEDMALEILKEIERLTRVKKMMEEAGKPF